MSEPMTLYGEKVEKVGRFLDLMQTELGWSDTARQEREKQMLKVLFFPFPFFIKIHAFKI